MESRKRETRKVDLTKRGSLGVESERVKEVQRRFYNGMGSSGETVESYFRCGSRERWASDKTSKIVRIW